MSDRRVECPSCAADLCREGNINFDLSQNGTASAIINDDDTVTWGIDVVENVYDLTMSCSNCGTDIYNTVFADAFVDDQFECVFCHAKRDIEDSEKTEAGLACAGGCGTVKE